MKPLNLPLPGETWNDTFNIHDASKLQAFMRCNRFYFYRYILGWERVVPNVHLIFGEGWHRAMETLMKFGYSNEVLAEAYVKLDTYYREHFPEPDNPMFSTDHERFPKVPSRALEALKRYAVQYEDDSFETLFTEISGTVKLDEKDGEDRLLSYRLDAIVKDGNAIWGYEHKTGSKLTKAWSSGWMLKTQVALYAHSLFCMEPLMQLADPDLRVKGIIVNGTIFRKGKTDTKLTKIIEHVRVPIRKTKDMMRVFMWNAIHTLDQIEYEFERLAHSKVEDDVLRAFPMNTESCTDYGGCPYHDFCMSFANPLKTAHQIPHDMEVVYWNPHDREKTANVIFDGAKGEIKEASSKPLYTSKEVKEKLKRTEVKK